MEANRLLRAAEIDAEKISNIIRLVVFLTLLLVILFDDGARELATSLELVAGIYGVGTVVGLVLAWRGIFHPAIPYLFVTFDVTLVSLYILMFAAHMGLSSYFSFTLPAAGWFLCFLSMRPCGTDHG